MSETITDSHTFKPSKETFVVSSLAEDLLSDSRSIFATVAFSKYEEWAISFDA